MSVSYSDFKDYSDGIGKGSPEFLKRNAISRGYYAEFHIVREKFKNHPRSEFKNGGGDHQNCVKILGIIGNRDLKQDFIQLKEARKKADYDIDDTVSNFMLDVFQSDLDEFMLKIESK